jgi:hypothetical protein
MNLISPLKSTDFFSFFFFSKSLFVFIFLFVYASPFLRIAWEHAWDRGAIGSRNVFFKGGSRVVRLFSLGAFHL